MIKEFLADTPLAVFPMIAFFLFAATFLTVVTTVVVGIARRKKFDEVASLPLQADTGAQTGGNNR